MKYGVISRLRFEWSNGEVGYAMRRVATPGSVSSNHALVDEDLEGAGLLMRLVTEEERANLRDAIVGGLAEIEYEDEVARAVALIEGD